MTESKTRVQAHIGKGADIKVEAEREATGIVKPKAGLETDTVGEVKAGSKAKITAKMEERTVANAIVNTIPTSWAMSGGEIDTDFGPRAEGEATVVLGISCVTEVSAASGATHKDETGVDASCCTGEEACISSWFWNGEEADDQSSSKDEIETDSGPSINAEELGIEPVTGASCKPRPELEEEVVEELKEEKKQKEEEEEDEEDEEEDEDEEVEDKKDEEEEEEEEDEEVEDKEEEEEEEEEEDEEVFIGKWFWDGDDPGPMYRVVKPQVTCEIGERNSPKDQSEGTAWPKAPTDISALLALASQVPLRRRPVSRTAPTSGKKVTGSLSLDDSNICEGTSICLESVDVYPFESDTCTQTIEKIRCQIKIRELSGIKPCDCPCKMECCLGSEGFEKLVSLLKSNTDPLIHKIAQIAMGIINVHPLAPQLINEMGVLNVIESLLSFQFPNLTRKSEITLNPISAEEKQRMIDAHVLHMCKDTVTLPLNSPGQRSGLKELEQLTTDFDHHYIISTYLAELGQVLAQGNSKTRNLVLKIILNMSENPETARDMIDFDYLSVLKLIFSQTEAKANLVTAVAIFVNIKEHIRKGTITIIYPEYYDELKAMFREVKTIIEKL